MNALYTENVIYVEYIINYVGIKFCSNILHNDLVNNLGII